MEHLDGLVRNEFCDFDKPHKHAYQKGKIESNEQSKERGQTEPKAFEKSIVERIVREPGLGFLNPSEMD